MKCINSFIVCVLAAMLLLTPSAMASSRAASPPHSPWDLKWVFTFKGIYAIARVTVDAGVDASVMRVQVNEVLRGHFPPGENSLSVGRTGPLPAGEQWLVLYIEPTPAKVLLSLPLEPSITDILQGYRDGIVTGKAMGAGSHRLHDGIVAAFENGSSAAKRLAVAALETEPILYTAVPDYPYVFSPENMLSVLARDHLAVMEAAIHDPNADWDARICVAVFLESRGLLSEPAAPLIARFVEQWVIEELAVSPKNGKSTLERFEKSSRRSKLKARLQILLRDLPEQVALETAAEVIPPGSSRDLVREVPKFSNFLSRRLAEHYEHEAYRREWHERKARRIRDRQPQ